MDPGEGFPLGAEHGALGFATGCGPGAVCTRLSPPVMPIAHGPFDGSAGDVAQPCGARRHPRRVLREHLGQMFLILMKLTLP